MSHSFLYFMTDSNKKTRGNLTLNVLHYNSSSQPLTFHQCWVKSLKPCCASVYFFRLSLSALWRETCPSFACCVQSGNELLSIITRCYLLTELLNVLWWLSALMVLFQSTELKKEAKTVGCSLWFDISDLCQLSLDQIVTYTEQRQLVHPRQVELHVPLLHYICSAQTTL